MPKTTEYFKKLLKEKGFKVTSQRLVILEALQERPGQHLTAEEIYEVVKEDNPDIGLATIYGTIQLLVDLDMVDKLNLDDGQTRYEIGKLNHGDNIHRHHHLICLNCDKILTFEGDLLDQLEDTIEETMGFKVVDHEVKLYGYCEECMKKGKSNEDDL